MMNKFLKLVAVAEEMATQWNANDFSIEAIDVKVEGLHGEISFGGVVEYPVYHRDENVYRSGFGIQYSTLKWKWVNDEWERVYPTIEVRDESMDNQDLPF